MEVAKTPSEGGNPLLKQIKYEGATHDVDENKGAKNKMWEQPTIFMKTKDLFSVSHDVNENKRVIFMAGSWLN